MGLDADSWVRALQGRLEPCGRWGCTRGGSQQSAALQAEGVSRGMSDTSNSTLRGRKRPPAGQRFLSKVGDYNLVFGALSRKLSSETDENRSQGCVTHLKCTSLVIQAMCIQYVISIPLKCSEWIQSLCIFMNYLKYFNLNSKII